jgi:GDPmannose 4,6-dehydratase
VNNLAIIVGDRGQDGTLLRHSLEKQGIQVLGIGRRRIQSRNSVSSALGDEFSVSDTHQVLALVEALKPREIYYVAAHHVSSEQDGLDDSPAEYEDFHQVHVVGLLNFLWAIKNHSPNSRLFYAASSLVFSGTDGPIQSEKTLLAPTGFYGVTKAQGIIICRDFRHRYDTFVTVGILYNHESFLRPDQYLSKKLIKAALRISMGLQDQVTIGNLSAEIDWGYAPDYVTAFQMALRHQNSEDFIISSGESHSVSEFAQLVFEYFDLDYRKHVRQDGSILKRDISRKIGDNTKLKQLTGWAPTLDFPGMVRQLIRDYLASPAIKSATE